MTMRTIIKVDINGFSKTAEMSTAGELADYLQAYYQRACDLGQGHGWTFIKTIGDCVLFSAELQDAVAVFYNDLSKDYDVSLDYRDCDCAERVLSFDDYQCNDIFGPDINLLFMSDQRTRHL